MNNQLTGYNPRMGIMDDAAAQAMPADNIALYYNPVPVEEVLEKYGHWKPMHCRRPSEVIRTFLEGIPAPVQVMDVQWRNNGLMYLVPSSAMNPGRTRLRTSTGGLALLKHLAEANRKFRPFFEAYYSREAENHIALECVDLALGVLPTSFKRTIARNEEIAQRQREEVYRRAQDWQRQNPVTQPGIGPGMGLYQHNQLAGNPIQLTGPNSKEAYQAALMQKQMEEMNYRQQLLAKQKLYQDMQNSDDYTKGLLGGPSGLLGTSRGRLGSLINRIKGGFND